MNKRTDLYITEIGAKENNKQVASKIEETIVNVVKKTKDIQFAKCGRKQFMKHLSTNTEFMRLKMKGTEPNKLAEYIAKNVYADINVDALAER